MRYPFQKAVQFAPGLDCMHGSTSQDVLPARGRLGLACRQNEWHFLTFSRTHPKRVLAMPAGV
jgi:hypothetical protein